jgi:aminoglycoside 6-adenylyltransferase
LTDKSWISVFGDLAMVQEPDSNDLGGEENTDFSRSYGWLMLFKDGNRIDLRIEIKAVTNLSLFKGWPGLVGVTYLRVPAFF